jgi:hypothetical protein
MIILSKEFTKLLSADDRKGKNSWLDVEFIT